MLREFPSKQFFFGADFKDFNVPGAPDLFSGSFGVARALIRNRAPWVLTFEWKRSAAPLRIFFKLLFVQSSKSCSGWGLSKFGAPPQFVFVVGSRDTAREIAAVSQLLSAATLMRESHALTRFLGWVGRLVSSMPPEELLPID